MAVNGSVADDVRYWITIDGYREWPEAETCECQYLVVFEGIYQCTDCGTAYGFAMYVYDGAVKKRVDAIRRSRRRLFR